MWPNVFGFLINTFIFYCHIFFISKHCLSTHQKRALGLSAFLVFVNNAVNHVCTAFCLEVCNYAIPYTVAF